MAFQSPTYLGWDGIDLMEISYFPAVFFQTSWDNQLSRAINNILFEIIFFWNLFFVPEIFWGKYIMYSISDGFLSNLYNLRHIYSCRNCWFVWDIFCGTCGQYLNLLCEHSSFCWSTFDGNRLIISNWFCGNISCNWGQFFSWVIFLG